MDAHAVRGAEPMLETVALQLVRYALSEDVGTGDITTLNAIDPVEVFTNSARAFRAAVAA